MTFGNRKPAKPKAPKKPKPKTCKVCKGKFEPVRPMQPTCDNFDCKVAHATKHAEKLAGTRAKVVRKETKAAKEKLKTRSDYMKEAQVAFNTYIRARDRVAGYRCISSGRPLDWTGNMVDAGHYRSVGSAPHLRFDERNCHAQSKKDNQYLAGNAVDYRLGLICRIGLEAVEALECDQSTKKWSADDLQAIRNAYRAKARELKRKHPDVFCTLNG